MSRHEPYPHLASLALAICLLAASDATIAQTLYRCGKSFQDRPCAAGEAGQVIASGATRQAETGAAQDPVCSLRAEQARKIMWARETGRTRDDQLAAAKTEQERMLIQEVYLLRGGSGEVATMVRDRCIKERERAAPAGADQAATASPPVGAVDDPACTLRGEQARKIAWAREAGRSRSDQMASASGPSDRMLIEEVYMTRGMSPEVVAAVVERCNKERARQRGLAPPQLAPQDSPAPGQPPIRGETTDPRNTGMR